MTGASKREQQKCTGENIIKIIQENFPKLKNINIKLKSTHSNVKFQNTGNTRYYRLPEENSSHTMDRIQNGFKFQTALLEPRRRQSNRLKFLQLYNFQPRILYPAPSNSSVKLEQVLKKFICYAHFLKNLLKNVIYQNKRMNQRRHRK